MPRHIEEWRDELEAVDAEIIRLINRRAQLAIELLRLLRGEDLSVGSLGHDVDRLLILLYHGDGIVSPPLRKHEVMKLFGQISSECGRIAEREFEILERNGDLNSEEKANDE